jgi:hypothetical protein
MWYKKIRCSINRDTLPDTGNVRSYVEVETNRRVEGI